MDDLSELMKQAASRIASALDLAALASVEAELTGRRSQLAALRKQLPQLDLEERRARGSVLSQATATLRELIEARRVQLEHAAEAELLAADALDLTVPSWTPQIGNRHLVTQVLEEACDIFIALGFGIVSGPEVETARNNFDLLHMPPAHPSRAETDTLYVDYGPDPGAILLRTHTSPMQVRAMLAGPPPLYIVVPGRTFRADTADATHSPVFHQIEGLAVDKALAFTDLKGTLAHFARAFFGADRRTRFLPSYFPFTEPSAEMAISCFACDGSGCRVCKQTGWIELLGCGMVDPAVLEGVGYDPVAISGYAFGLGVERLAMLRHGVDNIRHFYDNDLRVLVQFK